MKQHELKTWPDPFQALLDGRKHHEVRRDDRGFNVGDCLWLREYQPYDAGHVYHKGEGTYGGRTVITKPKGFTGRQLYVYVTYKTPGGQFGLPKDLCVLSVERRP